MSRVLIASTDVVGAAMAGPGLRAWQFARSLAATQQVTLAVPGGSDLSAPGVELVAYTPQTDDLRPLLARADVVLGQGFVFERHPELLAHDLPLVVDLYDPLIVESLDLWATLPPDVAAAQHARYLRLTEALLRRGDLFLCANGRQRDYWLGALTMAGRVGPRTFANDRAFDDFIALLPSGIDPQPPIPGPALRVDLGLPADAFVLLWTGGLWAWFDPLTPIRAVSALAEELPTLCLCLLAGPRPNPDGPPFHPPGHAEAVALAGELGQHGRAVRFVERWIDANERGAWLCDADVLVSAHQAGLETHLAFRTRLLDHLWAARPSILSVGDELGEQMARAGAALALPTGDVEAWKAAIRLLHADAARRQRMGEAAAVLGATLTWPRVVEPLARFCASPRRAADHGPQLATSFADADSHPPASVAATQESGREDGAPREPGALDEATRNRLMRWLERQRPQNRRRR
jgi:glycosyltransferase involved in cell wall biosynthesis